MVSVVHDLPLDSDGLMWQEDNAGYSSKWTGTYKLLAIENEICILQLPNGSTNFRIIIVKTYLQEPSSTTIPVSHDLDVPKSDLGYPAKKITNNDNSNDIDVTKLPCQNLAHIHHLPTRFQNVADISVFLKNNNTSQLPFTESQCKKINGLLKKDAFKFVTILDILSGMRIFNSCFIDEIKNEEIATAFEKSRLVI